MKYLINYILLIACISCCCGCKKFLDEKPDGNLAIPTTIQDLQALLDFYNKVNQLDVGAGERSADDYYISFSDWQSSTEEERRVYTWEKDRLFSPGFNEWFNLYENVYRANVVLDEIRHIKRKPGDELDYNCARGHALFTRSRSFFQAVTTWALAYDRNTAATDPGIPLRMSSDFTIPSTRASVKESYEQILNDMKEAAALLPVIPLHMLRPSKPAAYGMLARIYLSMQQYDSALHYCDLSLQLKNNLLDFNTLNANVTFPFAPRFSCPEILFESFAVTPNSVSNLMARIDSNLYQSYAANDLRKTVFFSSNNNGTYSWKGSYSGLGSLSAALATDELYITRAECRARLGDVNGALADLNALLVKRWKTGFFQPVTAANATDALNKILVERRKELVMRCIRWWDIKRLNKEGAGINLFRKLNGNSYSLMANSPRFALEIPYDVIDLTGMMQNPR